MKVRQGFVSNSSTTSFCLYGTMVTSEQVVKAWNKLHDEEISDSDEVDIDSLFTGHKEIDLAIQYLPDDYFNGVCAVGIEWRSIKDDETGKQFKDRIEKAVQDIFGTDIQCSTHEEAWRDG